MNGAARRRATHRTSNSFERKNPKPRINHTRKNHMHVSDPIKLSVPNRRVTITKPNARPVPRESSSPTALVESDRYRLIYSLS